MSYAISDVYFNKMILILTHPMTHQCCCLPPNCIYIFTFKFSSTVYPTIVWKQHNDEKVTSD